MTRPLPPLNALRAFEVAARQGSFTHAAEEMNVTPAAVSHQVKRLENYLGVRLFRRLARGLALTPAGEEVLPEVADAFQRLARVAERLRESGSQHTITVTVAPSLAQRWLIPRIEHFHASYPGFQLRVDAREQLVDLRRDDVDVALRYGPGGYEDLHVESLRPQMVYPVCSPRLLDQGVELRTLNDLAAFTLLHVEWRHTDRTRPTDWSAWLQRVGASGVDARSGPCFGHQSMAIDAAVAGHGIALANDLLVTDDLASGRLVRPLAEATREPFGYFLVCLPEAAHNTRIQAFRSWVLGQMEATTEG